MAAPHILVKQLLTKLYSQRILPTDEEALAQIRAIDPTITDRVAVAHLYGFKHRDAINSACKGVGSIPAIIQGVVQEFNKH